MSRVQAASVLCGLLLLTGCSRQAPPPPRSLNPGSPPEHRGRSVMLTTRDEVTLRGAWLPTDSDKAPVLILLHRWGASRNVWQFFAERAARQGFHTLAVDLRGHGESKNAEGGLEATAMNPEQVSRLPLDVEAAVEFAASLPEVDSNRIGAVGDELGGHAALQYHVKRGKLQALCLLSPTLTDRGVNGLEAMAKLQNLPVFIIASAKNAAEAEAASQFQLATSVDCILKLVPQEGSGCDLLRANMDLADEVLYWFSSKLFPPPEVETK